MTTIYHTIGTGYVAQGQADLRTARDIRAALGDVVTVVNVGTGAGSYEPPDLQVVAVEPSREMIVQRPEARAPSSRLSPRACPSPTRPSTRRWPC